MIYSVYVTYYRQSVIGVGVEEEDKKHTWMEDADAVRYPIIYHITLTVLFQCF